MKKLLFLAFMFVHNFVFAQTINTKEIMSQDTVRVTICISDTGCHFVESNLQSIYNSRCIEYVQGYIVYEMYFNEFLDKNKKVFPLSKILWFYMLYDEKQQK